MSIMSSPVPCIQRDAPSGKQVGITAHRSNPNSATAYRNQPLQMFQVIMLNTLDYHSYCFPWEKNDHFLKSLKGY